MKKQIKDNIEAIDLRIGQLTAELSEDMDKANFENITRKLDTLVGLRTKLSDSAVKESNFPVIFSGAMQVSSILLVLYFEKVDAVTSKVFSTALTGFKRGV